MLEIAKQSYGIFGCCLVTVILIRHQYGDTVRERHRQWIDRGIMLVAVALVVGTIAKCWRNIIIPQPWDYPVFYTVGKAAVSGRAFYRLDVLRDVFSEATSSAPVPSDWLSWKGIGYWYLPPSALLIAPLGLFDYTPSLIIHTITQGAFFVASAVLLHRMTPISNGWRGLLEAVALMLVFRPVQEVFSLAQVVFGALFFLTVALCTIDEKPAVAGVALGVGALYKQLLAVIPALTLCMRKPTAAFGFVAMTTVAVVTSVLAFGVGVFGEYSRYGPSANPARYYFTGPLNQSLFATVYRTFGLPREDFSIGEALLSPRFALPAAILTLLTGALCLRSTRNPAAPHLKMILSCSLALLLSPFTLYHTVTLILPVFFVLYSHRNSLPAPARVIILFIASQYAVGSIQYIGGFYVLLSSWLCIAALLLGMMVHDLRMRQ